MSRDRQTLALVSDRLRCWNWSPDCSRILDNVGRVGRLGREFRRQARFARRHGLRMEFGLTSLDCFGSTDSTSLNIARFNLGDGRTFPLPVNALVTKRVKGLADNAKIRWFS